MIFLGTLAIPTTLWGLLSKKFFVATLMPFWIAFSTMLAAVQIDDVIPDTAWAQYPLVVLGAILCVALMRYWVQNEDKWRDYLREERARAEQFVSSSLKDQREVHKEAVDAILKTHSEAVKMISEAQRAAYEEALERNLNVMYKHHAERAG